MKRQKPRTERWTEKPCRFMEHFLNDALDGRCGIMSNLFVKGHLLHCVRCRRFVESIRNNIARLREARAADGSQEVVERMRRRLMDQPPPDD